MVAGFSLEIRHGGSSMLGKNFSKLLVTIGGQAMMHTSPSGHINLSFNLYNDIHDIHDNEYT